MNCTICGGPFVIGSQRNLHANCKKVEEAKRTIEGEIRIEQGGEEVVLKLMQDGTVRWK